MVAALLCGGRAPQLSAAATWSLLRLAGVVECVEGELRVLGEVTPSHNVTSRHLVTMATEDHTAGYGPGLATDYYKGFLERVLVAEEERRGPRDTAVGER